MGQSAADLNLENSQPRAHIQGSTDDVYQGELR